MKLAEYMQGIIAKNPRLYGEYCGRSSGYFPNSGRVTVEFYPITATSDTAHVRINNILIPGDKDLQKIENNILHFDWYDTLKLYTITEVLLPPL